MRPGFLRLEIIPTSRLNLNQDSFSRFEFRQLSKETLKLRLFMTFLLSRMEVEDNYVEVPILLQKIANSAATT